MFENINAWFNRKELRDEYESARLRKLERMMQDYVGRPNAHSWANGSALFEEAQGHVDRLIDSTRPDRPMRAESAMENAYEVASMREAEKLRQSFRPKRPKKKHLSHVRPARPVPTDVVAFARSLGVVVV